MLKQSAKVTSQQRCSLLCQHQHEAQCNVIEDLTRQLQFAEENNCLLNEKVCTLENKLAGYQVRNVHKCERHEQAKLQSQSKKK